MRTQPFFHFSSCFSESSSETNTGNTVKHLTWIHQQGSQTSKSTVSNTITEPTQAKWIMCRLASGTLSANTQKRRLGKREKKTQIWDSNQPVSIMSISETIWSSASGQHSLRQWVGMTLVGLHSLEESNNLSIKDSWEFKPCLLPQTTALFYFAIQLSPCFANKFNPINSLQRSVRAL